MRKKLLTMLLAVAGIIGIEAHQVPQVMNVMSRQTLSLNGDWHYIVDVQEEGYYDYYMNSSPIKLGQNRPKQTLNRIA